MTAEKILRVEKAQQTVTVTGGNGLWEGGLKQGIWVQGREEQQ
jgi:hypothetical protein